MTNPDNAVGTNGAFGGRTSVNALNDVAAVFTSRGIVSGWACAPSTGMTVALGGDGENRDVAIAEDNVGNRTTINNISGSAINVTLAAAPSANSRIDSIVAYVANPPQGADTAIDNPGAVGLIAVSGTVAANPSAPSETTIRSAITADGSVGSNAYYVVLANITIAAGLSTLTTDNIAAGDMATVKTDNISLTTTVDAQANFSTSTSYSSKASVTVPGGTYLVSASTMISSNDGDSNPWAHVQLYNATQGVAINRTTGVAFWELSLARTNSVSFTELVELTDSSTELQLRIQTGSPHSDTTYNKAQITAVRVG